MLYSGHNGTLITEIKPEKNRENFERCKRKIDPIYNNIVRIIINTIGEETTINSSNLGGKCLNLPEFRDVKNACKDEVEVNESEFFGLILLDIMINKDENDNWDVHKRNYNKPDEFKEYIKRV